MRAAVLHLASAGLGANAAYSDAFDWNEPSKSVSRSLGYEANGQRVQAVEGKPVTQHLFRLTKAKWQEATNRMFDIEIVGLDSCREMFGLPHENTAQS